MVLYSQVDILHMIWSAHQKYSNKLFSCLEHLQRRVSDCIRKFTCDFPTFGLYRELLIHNGMCAGGWGLRRKTKGKFGGTRYLARSRGCSFHDSLAFWACKMPRRWRRLKVSSYWYDHEHDHDHDSDYERIAPCEFPLGGSYWMRPDLLFVRTKFWTDGR